MGLWKSKHSNVISISAARGDRKEYCDLCHAETPYTRDTPISERKYYLVGCGQLCPACYRRLEAEGMIDPAWRFVDDC